MKRLFLSALVMMGAQAFALPVLNPWEFYLINQGECCGDRMFPWFDCWDSVSLRVGYLNDNVFNRRLQVSSNGFNVGDTKIETFQGVIALNFCDRFEVFANLGSSKFGIVTPGSTFGYAWTGPVTAQSNPNVARQGVLAQAVASAIVVETNDTGVTSNGLLALDTNSAFSWSVGARIMAWQCGNWALGVDGRYFASNPSISQVALPSSFENLAIDVAPGNANATDVNVGALAFVPSAAPSMIYPSGSFNYSEWQVALTLARSICINPSWMAVPFASIEWAGAKVNVNQTLSSTAPSVTFAALTSGAPVGSGGTVAAQTLTGSAFQATLSNLKQQQNFGWAVGTSLVGCDRYTFGAEWRFANEKAFALDFNVSF